MSFVGPENDDEKCLVCFNRVKFKYEINHTVLLSPEIVCYSSNSASYQIEIAL